MSTLASGSPPVRRHALGMPAGSIRAILALMVVGLICGLMLLPSRTPAIPIPAYLLFLLFMILGHFYAAHGNTIAAGGSPQPSPLHLPSGFVRVVLIVALAATINWKLYSDAEGLKAQLVASVDQIKEQPFMSLILLGSFFAGVVVRWLVGREHPPEWLQNLEAWLALVSVVLLAVDYLIKLVINPSLAEPLKLPEWEGVLAGVIAFYFGERS
jgi:hypothetical protein